MRSEAVLERNRRSKAGVHLLGTNRGHICLDCPLFILDMQTYSSQSGEGLLFPV